MEKTSWGAPVELTSSEKADVILRAWREWLAAFPGQLIGSYVFFWGPEAGAHSDVVRVAARGRRGDRGGRRQCTLRGLAPPAANRTPRVNALHLDGKDPRQRHAGGGRTYETAFDVVDPDGDPLRYRWEVKRESDATQAGGDFEERIANIDGLLGDASSAHHGRSRWVNPGDTGCSPTHSTITGMRRTPHPFPVEPGTCLEAGPGCWR